jgi:hypothetical protein
MKYELISKKKRKEFKRAYNQQKIKRGKKKKKNKNLFANADY